MGGVIMAMWICSANAFDISVSKHDFSLFVGGIREKFWKIGNKERDGEYGACFFPEKCSAGQQPLIYCARPGSRMWEVNFDGEVLSTHQFKKLLSSPPLPVINLR